jgi:hypothetical protein
MCQHLPLNFLSETLSVIGLGRRASKQKKRSEKLNLGDGAI